MRDDYDIELMRIYEISSEEIYGNNEEALQQST